MAFYTWSFPTPCFTYICVCACHALYYLSRDLKAETQSKNIAAWTPVVTEVLKGFRDFDDQAFARYLPALYPLATNLLSRDMAPELRDALRDVFTRVGISRGITERT